MKRWIEIAMIVLVTTCQSWGQESYCVTIAGDTLWGSIEREEDVITIKQPKKEPLTLYPDQVKGFKSKDGAFLYSKPVRYFESSVMYGCMRLEIDGAVKFYSRTYAEKTQNVPGGFSANGTYSAGFSRTTAEHEYFLESDNIKIQRAANTDVVRMYIVGDPVAEERLASKKFKLDRHLNNLILEYNERHQNGSTKK